MEFRRRVCMGVCGGAKRGVLCQIVPEERGASRGESGSLPRQAAEDVSWLVMSVRGGGLHPVPLPVPGSIEVHCPEKLEGPKRGVSMALQMIWAAVRTTYSEASAMNRDLRALEGRLVLSCSPMKIMVSVRETPGFSRLGSAFASW